MEIRIKHEINLDYSDIEDAIETFLQGKRIHPDMDILMSHEFVEEMAESIYCAIENKMIADLNQQ